MIENGLEELQSTYAQHAKTPPPLAVDQVQSLAQQARTQLFDIAGKFAPQLAEYLGQDAMPEANEALQVRVQGASTYFTEKIAGLLQAASELSAVADNQTVAAALASQLRSLQLALFVKRACFAVCGGFATEAYNRATVNAELDFPKAVPSSSRNPLVIPKGVPHPTLYRQLLEWREQTSQRNGRPPGEILPNASLRELVTHLPTDAAHLLQIGGIGKARLRRYGKEIGELIQKYCAEQQLSENRTQ